VIDLAGDGADQEPWVGDHLDRRSDILLIEIFLFKKLDGLSKEGKQRSYVLNIDAPWGSGKSFFLEKLAAKLSLDGFLIARVNAWTDDHSDDPLTSVVSAIHEVVLNVIGEKDAPKKTLQAIQRNLGPIAMAAVRGATTKFFQKYLGDAAKEITELATEDKSSDSILDDALVEAGETALSESWDKISEKLLAEYRTEKVAADSFRDSVRQLTEELSRKNVKHQQIFVFIDELDRCRPDYAIRMLERIKHLFATSGVVFVVATDTSQLQHSVKAVYGEGFDSEKYLHRFFDRRYVLPARDLYSFVKHRIGKIQSGVLNLPAGDNLAEVISRYASAFGLSLRDVEQCIYMLEDVILLWSKPEKIELLFLLPLIMLTKANTKLLKKISDGTVSDDEWKYFVTPLGFQTSARSPENAQLSAWQVFKGFYDRRNWNFETVQRETNRNSQRDQPELWMNSCIYEELYARLVRREIDKNTATLLKEYPELVNSLSAFR
jgi:KAP family P-loop domain